jgi:hypothetical protein
MLSYQRFSYIMTRTSYIFQEMVSDVLYYSNTLSAIPLKQRSAGRHVTPLVFEHTIS